MFANQLSFLGGGFGADLPIISGLGVGWGRSFGFGFGSGFGDGEGCFGVESGLSSGIGVPHG